ncbi:MAG: helix-turn-helix domain-containing protein [Methanomicrobiales archaeon]|nr:helix-turn-helix domain-containing protein [Methanomicrobiales archaeon]
MPRQTASKVELSEKQKRILTEYAVGTHTPLHLKIRSQIVLHAANGLENNAIEMSMGIDPKTVKVWRDRYSIQYEELRRIEAESPHKIRSTIEKILSDKQRSGRPPTFKDEQMATIIAMACIDPAELDLPFSHWTPGLLQKEVIKCGIVDNISVRQVRRYLEKKISSRIGFGVG